jgi:hypothetical protein
MAAGEDPRPVYGRFDKAVLKGAKLLPDELYGIT